MAAYILLITHQKGHNDEVLTTYVSACMLPGSVLTAGFVKAQKTRNTRFVLQRLR